MESQQNKLQLSLDYRWVAVALLAVIVAMLAVWKPWTTQASDRTIEVTGTATVSARPDEFVFYPAYDFKNADKTAALEQMAAKSDEVVAGLKDLGVEDKNIKTNADSWSYPTTLRSEGGKTETTYSLRLTVTVSSEELAQKVQDYLVSTTPTGSISPQATFSEAKRKEIENTARDQAAQDARAKADQSAKNLGFKVSGVKTVNDGSGFGTSYLMRESLAQGVGDSAASPSLAVQPGENELTYSVTVTYFIR